MFIAKRVETSTTSLVVSLIGEAGVLVGGFLLRLLVILAALPVLFLLEPFSLRPVFPSAADGRYRTAVAPFPLEPPVLLSEHAQDLSGRGASPFRKVGAAWKIPLRPHWGMVIDLAKCVGCDSVHPWREQGGEPHAARHDVQRGVRAGDGRVPRRAPGRCRARACDPRPAVRCCRCARCRPRTRATTASW